MKRRSFKRSEAFMIISRVLRSDGGKSLIVPEAIAIDSWWFLAESACFPTFTCQIRHG